MKLIDHRIGAFTPYERRILGESTGVSVESYVEDLGGIPIYDAIEAMWDMRSGINREDMALIGGFASFLIAAVQVEYALYRLGKIENILRKAGFVHKNVD